MEIKTELQQFLATMGRTLAKMPVAELTEFKNRWQLLSSYTTRPDANREGFIVILSEIIANSPTLVANGYDARLANFSTRFAPGPDEGTRPDATIGLPPVHNEVVKINELIEDLIKKPKSTK